MKLNKKSFSQTAATFAIGCLSFSSQVTGQITTLTSSSNWQGGTWDPGQPGAGDNVVIASGVTGTAVNSVDPWSGSLTLESDALLIVQSTSNPNIPNLAIEGATSFILEDGARIRDNFKNYTFTVGFSITGVAGMVSTGPNSGWNQNRIFTEPITGTGTWTTQGFNHMGYTYNVPNTFSGGYIIEGGDRHGVAFNVAGAAGTGDVTVNPRTNNADGRSAVIILGADDVFAPTATLTLNGNGWAGSSGGFGPYASGPWVGNSSKLALQGHSATVSALIVDGVEQEPGVYDANNSEWIVDSVGGGTLTVTGASGGQLAITSIQVNSDTNEVVLKFLGQASTTYSCFSSVDLMDFSTMETPVDGSLTTDENGEGSVVLSSSEAAKYYRLAP